MTNCITNDAKTKVNGYDTSRRRLAYESKRRGTEADSPMMDDRTLDETIYRRSMAC